MSTWVFLDTLRFSFLYLKKKSIYLQKIKITLNRVSLDIMFPPLGAKIITEDQPLVAGRSVKRNNFDENQKSKCKKKKHKFFKHSKHKKSFNNKKQGEWKEYMYKHANEKTYKQESNQTMTKRDGHMGSMSSVWKQLPQGIFYGMRILGFPPPCWDHLVP